MFIFSPGYRDAGDGIGDGTGGAAVRCDAIETPPPPNDRDLSNGDVDINDAHDAADDDDDETADDEDNDVDNTPMCRPKSAPKEMACWPR